MVEGGAEVSSAPALVRWWFFFFFLASLSSTSEVALKRRRPSSLSVLSFRSADVGRERFKEEGGGEEV